MEHGATKKAAEKRKRKPHTRSKSGCLICRWRHARCDQTRPSCLNCTAWGTECIYQDVMPTKMPDEKSPKPQLPGMQALWRVHQSRPDTTIDPLGSLPISLPLRSRGLIQHFVQVSNDLVQLLPRKSQVNFVVLAAEDPVSFRSVFLTAASHYALKAGSLQAYESTYRFHMLECIRGVNKWLSNFDASAEATIRCVQAIAALSITESRVGNFVAARAHLDGLLSVLDKRDARRGTLVAVDDQDVQITDHLERCVLITEKFVTGLWNYWHETNPDNFRVVHQQRKGQLNDQDRRLQALSLAPFYLNTTQEIMSPKEIDVDHFFQVMRAVSPVHTKSCQHCSVTQPLPSSSEELSPEDAFIRISNGACDLLTWFGHAHSTEKQARHLVLHRSAPLAICILGGLYFNRILGFRSWDATDSIETRLFRRQMLVMKRDVQGLEQDMRLGRTSRGLWLIKVACVVLGMDIVKEQAGPEFLTDFGDSLFWSLRSWYVERIWIWATVTGVTEWTEAKKTFGLILGDQTFPRERHAKLVWSEAMSKSPQGACQVEDAHREDKFTTVDPWRTWGSRTAFFTM